jgi:transcriptional/translational regulatory protein YebC/TACO1
MFQQRGVMLFPPDTDEDTLMEAALEAGAEDVIANDDGSFEVLTAPEDFAAVRDALAESGLTPADAEVTMRPENTTELDDDDARKAVRLIERLEDLDDVQHVYTNAELQAAAYEDA